MKRICGLCSFCVALGMVLMIFIENTFIAVVIIAILMLLGYNLFSSADC
ncbi:MAG: hypothetical protein IJZ76_06390 [Lachnospiraceae bacterium]|nr:hypothetical protein [Lachnospiraceae bacterium]